jgi:ABC-type Na+ efflux pump permease subunit
MKISRRRVRAIFRKELREYRHNGNIIYAMVVLPMIFLIQPLVEVFAVPASAASTLHHEHSLVYMLAIPALVPAALASYSVVGERLQGTLEPVLSTPVRREELLLAKALAAFVPSVAVAYLVFAFFIVFVELFAHPGVASGLIKTPDLVAQLVFTPLLAAWSIWVGITISARSTDPRLPPDRGRNLLDRLRRDPGLTAGGGRLRSRPPDPGPDRLADGIGHI